MPLSRLARVLLCLAVTISTSAAWAGDPAAAEALFTEAQALMDGGQHEAACEKFEASMRADASGGTALNVALCAEKRGQRATAWAMYKRAAVLLGNTRDTPREAFAEKEAARLELTLNRLTIEAPSIEGLVVTRDGEAVDPATFGTAIPVDPGTHVIEASADGYRSWSTKTVLEDAGASKTVTVPELVPASVPAPAPVVPAQGPSGVLVGGIVVSSIAAIALGFGGALGALTLSKTDDARTDPSLCPNEICQPAGRAVIDEAEDMALGANILLGVGAASAIAGVIMIVVGAGERDAPSAMVEPLLSPESTGIRLRF